MVENLGEEETRKNIDRRIEEVTNGNGMYKLLIFGIFMLKIDTAREAVNLRMPRPEDSEGIKDAKFNSVVPYVDDFMVILKREIAKYDELVSASTERIPEVPRESQ